SVQCRNIKIDSDGWKTYLLSTLGRGGNGLYMMDVTDHDSPAFKWYTEVAAADKSGKKNIITMTWEQNEQDVISKDMTTEQKKFLKLGFNSPRPEMGIAPLHGGDGVHKNFIALPGGMQNPVDLGHNGKDGAVFFMLDPKDGKAIRVFDGSDLTNPDLRAGGGVEGPAPYMGMMVSEPTLVRSEKNSYMTGQILAPDNRGNIFRIRLEDKFGEPMDNPEDWEIETVATLQREAAMNTSSASYSVYGGLAAGIYEGNEMWAAGGTADISAPSGSGGGTIRNERQMIFSFSLDKKTGTTQVRDRDWVELKDSGDSDKDMKGWYIKLDPGDDQNAIPEYATVRPVLANGILYFGTFLGKKMDIYDPDLCVTGTETGDSRIYAIDMRTGGASRWSHAAKYRTLNGVKITGFTVSKIGRRKNLLVRYSKTRDKNKAFGDSDILNESNVNLPGEDTLNILLDYSNSNADKIPPGEAVIMYGLSK
ncbi:MAG: hypothetical protein LBO21_04305, partial [Synergistaceae bacterium]|nr:hypothetical protein [Synergistaceae bacterium]